MPAVTKATREGRCAVHWFWYCSVRYGAGNHAMRSASWQHDIISGKYPGWRVMRSMTRQLYGAAGGNRGAKRKVHIVKDQIVAKHKWYDEQRLTRWLCGAYTFEAIMQDEAEVVCLACLARHKGVTRVDIRHPCA